MKKMKSVAVLLMVITATILGLTACKNHCKEGEKCEKSSCCKKEDCSGHCAKEENCCNKCSSDDKASCEKKDSTACNKEDKKKCCKEDAAKKSTETTSGKYVCPMHSNITSDKPGNCSECGMKLEQK